MIISHLALALLLTANDTHAVAAKFHSDVKADEQVILFNTDAYLDENKEHWHIPVHAWVYENDFDWIQKTVFSESMRAFYDLALTQETKAAFNRRVSYFTADNERNKHLIVEIEGYQYTITATRANGHSHDEIIIPRNHLNINMDGQILPIHVVLKANDERVFSGEVRFLQPEGFSIISDIDDTAKVSHVLDKRLLIQATFYDPFSVIEPIAKAYHHCHQLGANLHFVSSSPWQLYPELTRFFSDEHFPWAQYSLKHVRFKDSSVLNLFKSGEITKPEQISELIEHYPLRQFILVGDSGESDPEAYAAIAEKYPRNIAGIFIRQVEHSNFESSRFESLQEGLAVTITPMADEHIQDAVTPLCQTLSELVFHHYFTDDQREIKPN